jgi:hypothetical protein
MPTDSPVHLGDLRAYSRLTVDATLGVTGVVEHMHRNLLRLPWPAGKTVDTPARGLSGLVYRSIRGITRGVGTGLDAALGLLPTNGAHAEDFSNRDALLAALNGVVGDHLLATDSPLRIDMRLRRDGRPLDLGHEALAAAIPDATGRIVVVVHGLCMGDRQMRRNGHEHGAALAMDAGYTPVYLHYNSGLRIADNGRAFAAQLEALVQAWPVEVERLCLLGYSMGGLLVRSACSHARHGRHAWLAHLRDIVYLGTPHTGSPLERGGHRIDALLGASPYTAALSRLGKLRSAGITDLRHADVDEAGEQDRHGAMEPPGGSARPGPLPRGVRCHAIAGCIARTSHAAHDRLLGDGLVPLDSALGLHANPARSLRIPASRRWIGHGLHHLDLLDDPAVYRRIHGWLSQAPARKPAGTR